MKKCLLWILMLAISLCACRQTIQEGEIEESNGMDDADAPHLIALYKETDSLLMMGKMDIEKMQLFVDRAWDYAEKYPEDTLSPHFKFFVAIYEMKIAGSNPDEREAQQQYFHSIDHFDQLIEQYPDYVNLPYCYYYQGMIYENLHRISDAESEYRELVHRYPDTELGKNIVEYLKVQGYAQSADDLRKKF